MGILFFLIGFIFLLGTGGALAFDALYYLETNQIDFASVSQLLLIMFGADSQQAMIAQMQNLVGGRNWLEYGEPYLASPAFATPLGLSVFFFLLAYLSRKPKIPQEEVQERLETLQGGAA